MIGLTGGDVCAPIWRRFMEMAHKGLPVKDFPDADDVPGASDARVKAKALRKKLHPEREWVRDWRPAKAAATPDAAASQQPAATKHPVPVDNGDTPPAGWQFDVRRDTPPGLTEIKPVSKPKPTGDRLEEPVQPLRPGAVKPQTAPKSPVERPAAPKPPVERPVAPRPPVERPADPNPAPADVPL
jgi:membrane peptidoglycan carboxypeptidase